MKKIISLILVLVVALSLAACGGKKEAAVQNEVTVSNEVTVETTLSPREQFEQTKKAMEELNKETEPQPITPCSFSAGGITLNLDSSFTADYEAGKELMTYWHSNGDSFSKTMKIGITRMANYGGYTTSQEAAEDIAAQKPEQYTVESANGVYYIVSSGNVPGIKAYYVDDSGYYWVIDGYSTDAENFNQYKDQLVQFCTTGSID